MSGDGEPHAAAADVRSEQRTAGADKAVRRRQAAGPAHRRAKREREVDFLESLLQSDGARTAVLLGEAGGATADDAPKVLAACTFVHHASAGLCEMMLLAARSSRRGLGSALLRAVERWLRAAGVRCVVTLAGEDTLEFWRKRGYEAEHVTLPPELWALLRDPFGQSRMVAKWVA
jgi:GNAT superfamily N-acetyltransferase